MIALLKKEKIFPTDAEEPGSSPSEEAAPAAPQRLLIFCRDIDSAIWLHRKLLEVCVLIGVGCGKKEIGNCSNFHCQVQSY